MNQQNQGSSCSSPSNVQMKRKRGRPRKEESAVRKENIPAIPVMPGSDNVLNSNQQTAGTTDNCNDEMVGRVVNGVIEGTFNAGYLLNVRVADTDTCLRGLVFLPGQVAPVTAENDLAPDVRMVERKEIPIPVPNPQTPQIHGSIPLLGQCSKQTFEPELHVPISENQALPAKLDSGISVSLENQSASNMIPMADLPKNDASISTEGMPQEISVPGHENQSASIMLKVECDKSVKQDETLHELDASRKVKESSHDGEATKDSEPASEPINLVPTIENTDNEVGIGQQAVPAVHKLNELIHDEKRSNIELNQIPVSAEPESMPSEQISKSDDNFVQKQASPRTDILEDTKTELAIETSSKVDPSSSNERPGTGVANILDVGSDHALETVPSEAMCSNEGIEDPQNRSSFSAFEKGDVNQPTESLVNSVESESQIGTENS